jgi:hypothetical protein
LKRGFDPSLKVCGGKSFVVFDVFFVLKKQGVESDDVVIDVAKLF